jgi:thymidylate synthase
MKQYLDSLQYILDNGTDKQDRTGVGTRSVFGHQMRFDLRNEFPAVTTKKLAWKAVVSELLWMLEGSADERRLAEILYDKPREDLVGKNTIWTANADAQAKDLGYVNTDTIKDLGPVYGHQWRSWDAELGHVDQIAEVLENLYHNPDSRRHIVSAWNADRVNVMALPPCHTMFQFNVTNGELSCQLYQRSADMFLGVPFNIASYSLLTHMFAQLLDLEVGDFVWTGGDCHIYQNHFDQVQQQLERTPRKGPTLEIPFFSNLGEIKNSKVADYKLIDYNPMDSIAAPMAV